MLIYLLTYLLTYLFTYLLNSLQICLWFPDVRGLLSKLPLLG